MVEFWEPGSSGSLILQSAFLFLHEPNEAEPPIRGQGLDSSQTSPRICLTLYFSESQVSRLQSQPTVLEDFQDCREEQVGSVYEY